MVPVGDLERRAVGKVDLEQFDSSRGTILLDTSTNVLGFVSRATACTLRYSPSSSGSFFSIVMTALAGVLLGCSSARKNACRVQIFTTIVGM